MYVFACGPVMSTPPTTDRLYSKLMDEDVAFHGFTADKAPGVTLATRLRSAGPQRLITVGLAVLCAVLLISIIAVAAHKKNPDQRDGEEASKLQKQTQDANLTALTATNYKLQQEKQQLQEEKQQLQEEKQQLQQEKQLLQEEKQQLQEEKQQLQEEKQQLQLRLAATEATAASITCPDDWASFGGSCYLVSTVSRDWPSAQTFCQQHGAHLAIITTAEEQTFVWDLLPRGHWNAYWFGITDEHTEDQWKWVDGSALVGGFWEEGEPNNHIDEDCGYIVKTLVMERVAVRSWYDAPCSMYRPFICEKD